MLDAVSMFDDDLMEAMLEENVTQELLDNAIRTATIAREITPVFCGSAYKNKGVQVLLDCVNKWLPAPDDVVNEAIDMAQSTETEEVMVEDPDGQLAMLPSRSSSRTVATVSSPTCASTGRDEEG